MALLELLERLRNPVFDFINMVFTVMGEGLFFIIILCLIFWCFDKKLAYRICFIYVIAGLAIQTLKVSLRIERPFVRNTSLSPVEAAKKTATGYSFPSGHTQNATSLFLTFSHICKIKIVKCLCFIPIFLVMFSRMYLGVHTPYDVLVSFLISAMITMVVNYIFDNFSLDGSHKKWVLLSFITLIAIITIYAAYLCVTVAGIKSENMIDIFKACGAAVGFLAGWYLETSRIQFNEKAATPFSQTLKFITGMALLVGIKTLSAYLLSLTGLSTFITKYIEYALLTFFITGIYPIIIKKVFTDKELAYRH